MIALACGQASVGAGVMIGSDVVNLAALLGLAGWIGFHRRVMVPAGGQPPHNPPVSQITRPR